MRGGDLAVSDKTPLVLGEGRIQQLQPTDELDNSRYSYEQHRERLFRKLLLMCVMQGIEIDDPELQQELELAIAEH
jgi:hypothetical protein